MFSEDSVRDQGERHGKVKLLTAVKGSSVFFIFYLPINFNQVPVDLCRDKSFNRNAILKDRMPNSLNLNVNVPEMYWQSEPMYR